ncbi:uncharacterized protein LOC135622993 isoform X1 [Musa acuminata AAA Group]|uniref:uncharacterized protein LOC135622993 isoform X1 n=2 Tax=Musa acuminata AAA Group TaxID=214697 RepID=UPI0031E33441
MDLSLLSDLTATVSSPTSSPLPGRSRRRIMAVHEAQTTVPPPPLLPLLPLTCPSQALLRGMPAVAHLQVPDLIHNMPDIQPEKRVPVDADEEDGDPDGNGDEDGGSGVGEEGSSDKDSEGHGNPDDANSKEVPGGERNGQNDDEEEEPEDQGDDNDDDKEEDDENGENEDEIEDEEEDQENDEEEDDEEETLRPPKKRKK